MPGLLAFHAHPDDEVTSTGSTLARYADQGEQVVVVIATDGVEGEIHNYDDIDAIRPVLPRRAEEIAAALDILGVKQHEFLGYRDSGMRGPGQWTPRVVLAGRSVRGHRSDGPLIRRHQPEVMVIYDPFGGYGHPDHIQVHRVGLAAFVSAGDLGRFPAEDGEAPWTVVKLYWNAIPRRRMETFADARVHAGLISEEGAVRMRQMGTPDEHVTAWLDNRHVWERKKQALRAHRSQIPDDWFRSMCPSCAEILGTETL